MIARIPAVLLLGLCVGCASARPSAPRALLSDVHSGAMGEPAAFAPTMPAPVASVLGIGEGPVPEFGRGAAFAGELRPAPLAPTPAPRLLGGGGGYTGVKAGVFLPTGDLSDLDTGASAELVFGHELLSFLAVEGSVGFLSAETSQLDFQGIPLYVQARANLPITVLEFYGGIGVGTMYVDVNGQVNSGSSIGRVSKSEFAAAANAFLGAEVGLGNLAVGIEGKYQRADDVGGVEVEGTSVMVTGRLPF